jgi:ferredoxin
MDSSQAWRIPQADLPSLLSTLAGERRVITREDRGGTNVFTTYSGGIPALDGNSAVSLRAYYLPQTEPLFRYGMDAGDVTLYPAGETAPAVVFAARPCDLAALELLDRVLLEGADQDTAYRARRAATVNVALACDTPGPGCFCRSVGLSPTATTGADVMAYPDGDALLAVAVTPRGQELFGSLRLSACDPAAVGRARRRCEEMVLPVAVDPEPVVGRLADRFQDPYWAAAARRCLGCGICTYVCPTCYCFAVYDINGPDCGTRIRCWDSCMFKDFLLMAGGHNPRPTRTERFRQRFMHKLQYYPEQHGGIMCVGCGRCLEKCPAGLDISGVVLDLGGEK